MNDDKASEKLAKEWVNSSDWQNVQAYILAAWSHDPEMKAMDKKLAKDLMDWTNNDTRRV